MDSEYYIKKEIVGRFNNKKVLFYTNTLNIIVELLYSDDNSSSFVKIKSKNGPGNDLALNAPVDDIVSLREIFIEIDRIKEYEKSSLIS